MSRVSGKPGRSRRGGVCTLALWMLMLAMGASCDDPSSMRDYQIDTSFELIDQSGSPFRMTDLRGKIVLLYFGFTHCPDFCPATLSKLAKVKQILGNRSRHLQVVFVSVDPERDTPDALKNYLSFFSVEAIGLTGAPERIAEVAQRFGAHYLRQPLDSDASASEYTVDHSTGLYLIDGDGRVRHVFKHGDSPQQIADMLQMVLPFI